MQVSLTFQRTPDKTRHEAWNSTEPANKSAEERMMKADPTARPKPRTQIANQVMTGPA